MIKMRFMDGKARTLSGLKENQDEGFKLQRLSARY